MINFDYYTHENKTKNHKKWPHIPDHPYRGLITGQSYNRHNHMLKCQKILD